MINDLILSVAGLFAQNDNNQLFYAEKFTIPKGDSEISVPFEFNGLTLLDPERKEISGISYKIDGKVYDWENPEDLKHNEESDILNLAYFAEPRKSLIIHSETERDVIAHFFNTHIENEPLVAKFEPFDDDSFDDPKTGLARRSQRPKFISRRQWRADESLRVWKPSRGLSRGIRSQVPEAKNIVKKLRPTIIKRKNNKGKNLTWPLEKNKVLKKFVVHHTAETTSKTTHPMELMRAIYYYHTITRGWGDIGYNYVIDRQGNIYEGRAGGAEIVGAHAAYYNVGTIGISLMGNFQIEKPTPQQVKILTLLLADHSNRYNIPLGRSTYWLGKHTPNISGHRDVAKKGHGTSCPGNNLHKLLPQIRKKAKYLAQQLGRNKQKAGVDFLRKSKYAPKIQRRISRNQKTNSPIKLNKLIKKKIFQRGGRYSLDIEVKNLSNSTWRRGERLTTKNLPEGISMTSFRLKKSLAPNQVGVFRANLKVDSTPNGNFQLEVEPKISSIDLTDEKISVPTFLFPIQVSGAKNLLTKRYQTTNTVKKNKKSNYIPKKTGRVNVDLVKYPDYLGPEVKVKLSYFEQKYAILTSKKTIQISSKGEIIQTIPPNTKIRLIPENQPQVFRITAGDFNKDILNPQFKTNGIITIQNYDRGMGVNKYNQFRRQINAHKSAGKSFYLVNTLPLEEYLWGLAEEPSTEPDEKKHAIHILARSYGYVYGGDRRKFRTQNYDLEDSPKTSQFYLGYGWEKYHNDQKQLIKETQGKVLTYHEKPVIGPYFTQSGGASSSLWVKQYPWTVGRKLPYDEGLEPKGHGVGFSGNSARVLAKNGKNYKEILDYFYTDTGVKKVY